jgi:hypothetical protein
MMTPLTSEDFDDWLTNPVTEVFRKHLGKMVEQTKGDWASGLYTAESSEGTAQKNAVALGSIRILEDILNITYEDL